MNDDMLLPEGRHCRDCIHHKRCEMLFGCGGQNTRCDWSPSKFVGSYEAGFLAGQEEMLYRCSRTALMAPFAFVSDGLDRLEMRKIVENNERLRQTIAVAIRKLPLGEHSPAKSTEGE